MLHDDYLCLVESGKQQMKEVTRKFKRKTGKQRQLLSESGFVLRTAPPSLSRDRRIKMKKSKKKKIYKLAQFSSTTSKLEKIFETKTFKKIYSYVNTKQLSWSFSPKKLLPITRKIFASYRFRRSWLGSIPGPIESDTVPPMVSHRCDVFRGCCPGAKPQRWG